MSIWISHGLPRPWDLCQRYASDFLELLNAQDALLAVAGTMGKHVFLHMLPSGKLT